MMLAYLVSMATLIWRGVIPWPFISITPRVIVMQIPQVGAIVSNTTLPSGFTASM
jgi:hypothetical protein